MSNKEVELPHNTIKKVQKGLETLKKKAEKQKSISSETFLKSLKNLNENLSSLSNLFQEAAKDIKEEEETTIGLKEKIDPLLNKVNALEDENKKIAQGILTIADMIKELQEKIQKPAPPMFMRAGKPPMVRKPMPPKMPRPGPMPPRPPGAAMPPRMPRPRFPGAAMHPPRPDFPKKMPAPPPIPPPFGPPGVLPLRERPSAPRPGLPPEKPPGFPPRPEAPLMPVPTKLPPLPVPPKKKGFFARLFKK